MIDINSFLREQFRNMKAILCMEPYEDSSRMSRGAEATFEKLISDNMMFENNLNPLKLFTNVERWRTKAH